MSESVTFKAKGLSITACTVDVIVWSITSCPGVQDTMANGAFEAAFMVNSAFGKNLVGMVDETTAFGTSLAFGSLEAFALLQDVITIPNDHYRCTCHLVFKVESLPSFRFTCHDLQVSCGALVRVLKLDFLGFKHLAEYLKNLVLRVLNVS